MDSERHRSTNEKLQVRILQFWFLVVNWIIYHFLLRIPNLIRKTNGYLPLKLGTSSSSCNPPMWFLYLFSCTFPFLSIECLDITIPTNRLRFSFCNCYVSIQLEYDFYFWGYSLIVCHQGYISKRYWVRYYLVFLR